LLRIHGFSPGYKGFQNTAFIDNDDTRNMISCSQIMSDNQALSLSQCECPAGKESKNKTNFISIIKKQLRRFMMKAKKNRSKFC